VTGKSVSELSRLSSSVCVCIYICLSYLIVNNVKELLGFSVRGMLKI
jgi:hypothetical protein